MILLGLWWGNQRDVNLRVIITSLLCSSHMVSWFTGRKRHSSTSEEELCHKHSKKARAIDEAGRCMMTVCLGTVFTLIICWLECWCVFRLSRHDPGPGSGSRPDGPAADAGGQTHGEGVEGGGHQLSRPQQAGPGGDGGRQRRGERDHAEVQHAGALETPSAQGKSGNSGSPQMFERQRWRAEWGHCCAGWWVWTASGVFSSRRDGLGSV